MNATKSVTLGVSREGTVRTLADQFTSYSTFIKELLQNSRRAGASVIKVIRDGDTLSIEDDGHGINDPQVLFSIGQSDWGNDTLADTENPFGIGFTASLFAADHIHIQSNGWSLNSTTSDILRFEHLPVMPSAKLAGKDNYTFIELVLTDALSEGELSPTNCKELFKTLALAFPVPIEYNGQVLPSPLRKLPGGVSLEYGTLQGDLVPTDNTKDVLVLVLQGFVLATIEPQRPYPHAPEPWSVIRMPVLFHEKLKSNYDPSIAVLHLDSSKVRARVPDREVLIDQSQAFSNICKTIIAFRGEKLAELKRASNMPGEFVKKYFSACIKSEVSYLLNDQPLPCHRIKAVDHVMAEGSHANYDNIYVQGGFVCKGGEERFLFSVGGDDTTNEQANRTTLNAYCQDETLLLIDNVRDFHKDHWVFDQAAVKTLSAEEDDLVTIVASPVGELATHDVEILDGCTIELIIAEHIQLTPQDSDLKPIKTYVPCYCVERNAFLVTPKSDTDDCRSALLAYDEYGTSGFSAEVNEELLDTDIDKFYNLGRLYGGASIETLLAEAIDTITRHYGSAVASKSFSLAFCKEGKPNVTIQ